MAVRKKLVVAALAVLICSGGALGYKENPTPEELARALSKAKSMLGDANSTQAISDIGKHYAIVNSTEDHCNREKSKWFALFAMMARERNEPAFMSGMSNGIATMIALKKSKSKQAVCESMWGFYGVGSRSQFDGALDK
jgi:hypothetical protein